MFNRRPPPHIFGHYIGQYFGEAPGSSSSSSSSSSPSLTPSSTSSIINHHSHQYNKSSADSFIRTSWVSAPEFHPRNDSSSSSTQQQQSFLLQQQQQQPRQPFDFYCVVDVEATCDEDSPFERDSEIIELPCILVESRTMQVVDEFHTFVCPEHEQISSFCTNLTGIGAEMVRYAPNLRQAMEMLELWLRGHNLAVDPRELSSKAGRPRSFAFVCDGPWDMKHFLAAECARKCIRRPPSFDYWVNIRWLYSEYFRVKRRNIEGMLSALGMEFVGRPHSGLDDTRNLCRLAKCMAQHGCCLRVNDGLSREIAVDWRPSPLLSSPTPGRSNKVLDNNNTEEVKEVKKAEEEEEEAELMMMMDDKASASTASGDSTPPSPTLLPNKYPMKICQPMVMLPSSPHHNNIHHHHNHHHHRHHHQHQQSTPPIIAAAN